MARTKDAAGSAVEQLRQFGLRYPGAHTKSPWPGHLDLAVNDKTFAYLSHAGEPLSISCKLPRSAEAALSLTDASLQADNPDTEPPASRPRRAARPPRSTVKRAPGASPARATSGAAKKRTTARARSERGAASAKKRPSVNQRATQRARKKR
jgi:hypothetical protein